MGDYKTLPPCGLDLKGTPSEWGLLPYRTRPGYYITRPMSVSVIRAMWDRKVKEIMKYLLVHKVGEFIEIPDPE